MECNGALFIIDDVMANQIMQQEESYTYYQVLHEERFYEHLLDMMEIRVESEYVDTLKQTVVLLSWQEIRNTLREGALDQMRWEKLFSVCQDRESGQLLTQTSFASIEEMLKKAIEGRNYVMFYC